MMLGRILKSGSLADNIATKSPNDVHYNIPHLTVRQYAEDDLNYEEITEGGASKSMMENVMSQTELERLSTDDLWSLHVEVSRCLQQRILSEKLRLEERLKLLEAPSSGRRPYPPVSPKYRNPDEPAETWAGRGKQPRWLVAQLRSGKRIDDFRIRKTANTR